MAKIEIFPDLFKQNQNFFKKFPSKQYFTTKKQNYSANFPDKIQEEYFMNQILIISTPYFIF